MPAARLPLLVLALLSLAGGACGGERTVVPSRSDASDADDADGDDLAEDLAVDLDGASDPLLDSGDGDAPAGDGESPGDRDADPGDGNPDDPDTASDASADVTAETGPEDPGPPVFPDTIGTLSVALRTGTGANDGTNANQLSVCVSQSDCFRLNLPDVDDFRVGEIDVYHFENVAIPRDRVDRFELRSAAGTDRWNPVCAEMQFDGEPVYCRDGFAVGLGDNAAAGEVTSWRDPEGVTPGCVTCYPTTLTHGPMVGGVDAERARLWVRSDATRRIEVRLAATPEVSEQSPVAWLYPSPLRDYSAVAEVGGLRPDTTYYYELRTDEDRTATHSFRTRPVEGSPVRLRFAFGSCTRLDAQPIFARVAALAPDFFVFVGDAHYANSADLGALRWFYRWGLERPERAALLADTPTLAIWDDHDFTGNNTLGTAPGKAVALRAFAEYWANPGFGSASLPGVFFTYRVGDVELFLLDDRYYRALDGSLLGAEQTAWLLDALAASTATFKFVASGSQFHPGGSSDSWAAYPAASEAFFAALRERAIEGVVLLSGDVHRSEFRVIERADTGGYDLFELTSSPMANTNSSCRGGASELSCFDEGNFFIEVEVDTTLPDPRLIATIWDETGTPRDALVLRRSDLELP